MGSDSATHFGWHWISGCRDTSEESGYPNNDTSEGGKSTPFVKALSIFVSKKFSLRSVDPVTSI